jgi:hypothetical protein
VRNRGKPNVYGDLHREEQSWPREVPGIACLAQTAQIRDMKKRILIFLTASCFLQAGPTPAAVSAFDVYVRTVETRLAAQHRSPTGFLAPTASDSEGTLTIERLTPSLPADFAGALLHHWRGTAFAPRAKAAHFDALMRDFNSYPQHFSPEVLEARVLTEDGEHIQAWMRVRQQHIITVVMDTNYDITFGRLDERHSYSISRTTRITEIDPDGDHGFLWRLNTYWSCEETDAGVYLQIEAVSLTRSIPVGLGWMIRPFVESIPRESLEFTLRSVCNALRK